MNVTLAHVVRMVHVPTIQVALNAHATLATLEPDLSVPILMSAQLRVHAVQILTVPTIQAHTNAHARLVSRVMLLLVVLISMSVPVQFVLQLEAHAATMS